MLSLPSLLDWQGTSLPHLTFFSLAASEFPFDFKDASTVLSSDLEKALILATFLFSCFLSLSHNSNEPPAISPFFHSFTSSNFTSLSDMSYKTSLLKVINDFFIAKKKPKPNAPFHLLLSLSNGIKGLGLSLASVTQYVTQRSHFTF